MGAYQLTKQDINVLRTADDLVIRYNLDDSIARIEANKRADDTSPWDQKRNIEVSVYTKAYSKYDESYSREVASAFIMFHCSKYDDRELRTFLDTLKVNDILEVEFTADTHSGALQEAGLHSDACRVTIVRQVEGKRNKRFTFLLEQSICQDNSARMCKVRTKQAATA